MLEELMTYGSILLFSMFKFIAGPLIGGAKEIPFYITGLLTAAGMMLAVVIFALLGDFVRKQIVKKRESKNKQFKIKKRHRRVVKVWSKFGIRGLSFLTPLIFTPIGGTLLASALGVPKRKIIFHMSYSALFWGMVLSFVILELEHVVVRFL